MYVLDGNRRLAAAQLGGIDTLSGIPVMHELTEDEAFLVVPSVPSFTPGRIVPL